MSYDRHKSLQPLRKLKHVVRKRADLPQKHKKQSSHSQREHTQTQTPPATMSIFWRRPVHPAPTFIGSSLAAAEKDKLSMYTLHIDLLSDMIKHVGLEDPEGLLEYFDKKVRFAVASRDVANLGDIPEDDAVNEPAFVGTIKTPKPGSAKVTTWTRKFTTEDWPRVAWELTRLTADEKAKINSMEIAELLEFVRKEWPDRVKIIFPPGYDGMLVDKMRKRVINKLRLGYEELKAMTDTGDDRDKKRFVVEYVRAVRPNLMKVD